MANLEIKNFQNGDDYMLMVLIGQRFGDILRNQLQLQQGIVINQIGLIINQQFLNNDITMRYYHNKWNDKKQILINIYYDENNFTLNQYDRSIIIEGAIMLNNTNKIIYDNIILESNQLYSSFNTIIKNEIGNADLFVIDKNFQKGSQILITLYSNDSLTQIQCQNSNDTLFRPKIIKNIVYEFQKKNSIVESFYQKYTQYNYFVFLSEFGILNTHDEFNQLYKNKNQAILILIPLQHEESITQPEEDKVLVRLWRFGIFLREEIMQRNKNFGEIIETKTFIVVISGRIAKENQAIEEFLKPEQKELNLTLVNIELIKKNQLLSIEGQEIFHELLLEKFLKNVFEEKQLNIQITPLSPVLKIEEVKQINQQIIQ